MDFNTSIYYYYSCWSVSIFGVPAKIFKDWLPVSHWDGWLCDEMLCRHARASRHILNDAIHTVSDFVSSLIKVETSVSVTGRIHHSVCIRGPDRNQRCLTLIPSSNLINLKLKVCHFEKSEPVCGLGLGLEERERERERELELENFILQGL